MFSTIKQKLKDENFIEIVGIAIPIVASAVYLASQNYYAAFWAGLCSVEAYNYRTKSKMYREAVDFQLELEKYLDDAEVEEIKEFLDRLSWTKKVEK